MTMACQAMVLQADLILDASHSSGKNIAQVQYHVIKVLNLFLMSYEGTGSILLDGGRFSFAAGESIGQVSLSKVCPLAI